MNKLVTNLLILFATVFITTATERVSDAFGIDLITGEKLMESEVLSPICQIDSLVNCYRVSYHIENITLQPDSLYPRTYTPLLEDFGAPHNVGEAALPLRIDRLKLPEGCDSVAISVINTSYTDIYYEIAPCYPPLYGQTSLGYNKTSVLPVISSRFGSISDLAMNYEIEQSYFGDIYSNIIVRPCQYDSKQKSLRVFTDFEYELKFIKYNKTNQSLAKPRTKSEARVEISDIIKKISVAKADSFSKIEFPDIPNTVEFEEWFDLIDKSYLIITTNKCLAAASEFAEFKKKFGYKTYLVAKSGWTANDVCDTIREYFNNDWSLKHALIIGGSDDIPGHIAVHPTQPNNTPEYYTTDYYFGTSDDNKTPQVFIGRIPATNNSDAQTALNKIMTYIQTPCQDDDFYNSVLNVGFYGGTEQEYDTFVTTLEELRETFISHGKNVSRVYRTDENCEPKYFDTRSKPLPADLLPPEFNWHTTSKDVIREMNYGPYLTLYRGHGQPTYWYGKLINNPILNTTHINSLANTNRLPIIFSMTCLSGNYKANPECLAWSMLKHPTGGAAGIIAATAKTPTDPNNELMRGMVNWMFNDKPIDDYHVSQPSDFIITNNYSYSELGRVFSEGLNYMKSLHPSEFDFQKKTYHLFGDPSMNLWSETPKEFKEYEVWCKPKYDILRNLVSISVMINLGNEVCQIAIKNRTTDEHYIIKGTSIYIPDFHYRDYSMIIYGVNRIPYEVSAPLTINIPVTINPPLYISPNPASSYCEIGYNLGKGALQPAYGKLYINSVSTGRTVAEYDIVEHMGKIQVDVSGFSNGEYTVTLTDWPLTETTKILSSAKLLVNH